MGEFTERWRRTHNFLADFGDDILSLRDLFKAAGEAEDILDGKDAAIDVLDARAASLRSEVETLESRLANQSTLVQQADIELAERKDAIADEAALYKQTRFAEVDAQVAAAVAEQGRKVSDATAKAERDLLALNAEIENKSANRDALANEVTTLMDRAQTYDRLIAEKAERLRIVEAKLADLGKFALGAPADG